LTETINEVADTSAPVPNWKFNVEQSIAQESLIFITDLFPSHFRQSLAAYQS